MTPVTTNAMLPSYPVTAIPFAALKAEMLANYGPGLAAPGTLKKLSQVLDLVEALGIRSSDQLTPELVGRFIAARPPGQSPHTLRSLLMTLRTVCSHAEEMRYVMVSPFRFRRMKISRLVRVGPPAGKRHCTRDEIRRVLVLLEQDVARKRGWAGWRSRRLLAAVATAAYTGARAGEVLRLHVDDLDLPGRIIRIRPHDRKLKTPGSEAAIGMPPALVGYLEAWLPRRLDCPLGFSIPPADQIPWLFPGTRRQGPWTQGAPGHRPTDRVKAVAARAGVVMTFQMLRRSWCTIAEGLGLSQPQITRQARHADPATTLRHYQQREERNLRDAVAGFEF